MGIFPRDRGENKKNMSNHHQSFGKKLIRMSRPIDSKTLLTVVQMVFERWDSCGFFALSGQPVFFIVVFFFNGALNGPELAVFRCPKSLRKSHQLCQFCEKAQTYIPPNPKKTSIFFPTQHRNRHLIHQTSKNIRGCHL